MRPFLDSERTCIIFFSLYTSSKPKPKTTYNDGSISLPEQCSFNNSNLRDTYYSASVTKTISLSSLDAFNINIHACTYLF